MLNVQAVSMFLSLGSNLGDKESNLQKAIHLLQQEQGIVLLKCSSIYETEPVGYTEQDLFLNIVVEGKTTYSPEELLEITQGIERRLGRTREIRFGPRTIDIDILLYHNRRIHKHHLMIPHPRMKERAFVMIPLAEIAGDLKLPGETKQVAELVVNLPKEGVYRWKSPLSLGVDEFEPLGS